jgi:hypothetical protein
VAHTPIFHPKIEADVRKAMRHYNGKVPGLGARFKNHFYEAVDAILFMPSIFTARIGVKLVRKFLILSITQ